MLYTLLLLLMLLVCPYTTNAQVQQALFQTRVTNGLVAQWRATPGFTGGPYWYDLTGRFHGTLTNMNNSATSGWGAATKFGEVGEVRFGGTDDYVNIASNAAIETPAMTMCVWVKATNWTPAVSGIMSSIVGGGSAYRQLMVTSTGKLSGFVRASGGGVQLDPAVTSMSTGIWYHIALTYDSIRGMQLWINAKQDGATQAALGTANTTGQPLTLGQDTNTAGRFFTGAMNDARIYNRALTQYELQNVMLNATQPNVSYMAYVFQLVSRHRFFRFLNDAR